MAPIFGTIRLLPSAPAPLETELPTVVDDHGEGQDQVVLVCHAMNGGNGLVNAWLTMADSWLTMVDGA